MTASSTRTLAATTLTDAQVPANALNTVPVPGGSYVDTRSVLVTQPLLKGAGVRVATVNQTRATIAFADAQQRFTQVMNELVANCVVAYFKVDLARQNTMLMRAAFERAQQLSAIQIALFKAGRLGPGPERNRRGVRSTRADAGTQR